MALLGGGVGGAGNPVGGSFTGVAQTLEVIGDHCYAYSGVANPGAGPTTYLTFTTGNFYIVGRIEANADWAGTGGSNFQIQIYLNGVKIVEERDVGNDYVPGDTEFHVIIPAYTEVQVDLSGGSAAANANLTGRIYRTRD